MPTAVQLYLTENYKEKVQSIVRANIRDRHIPKDQALEVVKHCTAESFSAEPLEVQQHFKDCSAKMKEEQTHEKDAVPAEPTPASYVA